jgi:hypothetical protein
MKRLVQFIVLIVLAVYLPAHTNAQTENPTPYAAVLRVTFAEVELLRANTVSWLPLSVGAEMPIGAGDKLRTDYYGRAMIIFGDFAEGLVLPGSMLAFNEYTLDESIRVAVEIQAGRAVFAVDEGVRFDHFQINVGRARVTAPAPMFGVQFNSDSGAASIIVGEGDTTVDVAGEMFTVAAGYGLRVGDQVDPLAALEPPYNFARLDGMLDGCPAVIEARGEASLNVRIGPSFDYDTVGSVPNETPVYLMAVSPNGERFRIQFFSGFGWILATGVRNRCVGLPVLPYSSVEFILRVFRPQPRELELLRPFFGEAQDDVIFYILPED